MRYLEKDYDDRGMKKWGGFYLSDHTAKLTKQTSEGVHVNLPKDRLSIDEVGETIQNALLKSHDICVQLEAVNEEGYYYDDICGPISGYDSLGLYIGEQKVDYDEIRHVSVDDTQKWSDFLD